MMAVWIGLTGGIGSGKSQVAKYFQALGVPVIDADAVNTQLIDDAQSPAMPMIRQKFGNQAITETGVLNRPFIRDLIFTDPHAKHALEAILHPLILANIQSQQHAFADAIYGIVELPLLRPHSPFLSIIQRILVVTCDEHIRIERVMQRNGLSAERVRAIIASQPSDAERLALADDVIDNSGNLDDLKVAVYKQHLVYQDILHTS